MNRCGWAGRKHLPKRRHLRHRRGHRREIRGKRSRGLAFDRARGKGSGDDGRFGDAGAGGDGDGFGGRKMVNGSDVSRAVRQRWRHRQGPYA